MSERQDMVLPAHGKKTRMPVKLRVCIECGKEYYGHPVQKRCGPCNTPENALKQRRESRKSKIHPDIVNQAPPVNTPKRGGTVDIICRCKLPGCGKYFQVVVYPKIDKVPMFCENHRNEHKRKVFVKK